MRGGKDAVLCLERHVLVDVASVFGCEVVYGTERVTKYPDPAGILLSLNVDLSVACHAISFNSKQESVWGFPDGSFTC